MKEATFWKGPIAAIPHSLYRGSGVSHDGSFFLGQGESGSLKRIDLVSGREEVMVKNRTAEEYAFASAVSPDDKQIAYQWFNGSYFDLLLTETSAPHGTSQSRTLVKGSEQQSAIPHDWSPDGKQVLVNLIGKNAFSKIALISKEDGQVRIIKDVGKRICNKISFSPDGKYIVYDYWISRSKSDIRLVRADGTGEATLVRDNGSGPYWSPDGRYIFFLSGENDSNNLMALQMKNAKPKGDPVVLKEGIDFYSPLGFIKDGSFLYGESSPVRLDVFVTELDPETLTIVREPYLISRRFPGWNTDANWSPDGRYLVYKSARGEGKDMVVVRSADTGEEQDIMLDKGSIVQWFPDNRSIFTVLEKENGSKELYQLNTETKGTTLLFDLAPDADNGVMRSSPVLSADGEKIFYIESNRRTATAGIYMRDIQTKAIRQIAAFDTPDITSFSASPDGKFLSLLALYQLQEGRPCALRIVSLETGEIRELFKEPWGDPTKFFGLGWSPDSQFIHYVRKDHETSDSHVWRIPFEGGLPENTGITMGDLRMPKVHPDGKRIVFHGGDGWYKRSYEIKAIRMDARLKSLK